MNNGGRIVLCGQISVYNTDLPYPPPIPPETAQIIRTRNIQRWEQGLRLQCFLRLQLRFRERFIVLAYKDEMDAAVAQLSHWLQENKLKVSRPLFEIAAGCLEMRGF